MNNIFEKYIPKFEYELIDLNKYSFADLAEFEGVLSLFMMISKIKTGDALSELGKLPKDYSEHLKNMNVPPHLMEVLVKVVTVLLRKIDVPQEEIDSIVEKIDERGINEMISIENYSVRETRRIAREEARAEERHRTEEERRRAEKAELRLKSIAKSLLDNGSTIADIAAMMSVSERDITDLLPEFA